MFEGLPFGINLSSQARAGFAALSAHAAVIALAIYGSEQPSLGPRAVADTVAIELPRMPVVEQASSGKKPSPSGGSLPSAPLVPATPLTLPSPGFAVDSTHTDHGLEALRSLTISEALETGGGSERPGSGPAREVDQLPMLKGDLRPRYPDELRATPLTGKVVVEYVVNAEGRVDAGSVRIVQSSHPAFSR
ncbi:MAG TPA: energy transducer TonB, partial [Gemmatimonadales bacterium]